MPKFQWSRVGRGPEAIGVQTKHTSTVDKYISPLQSLPNEKLMYKK